MSNLRQGRIAKSFAAALLLVAGLGARASGDEYANIHSVAITSTLGSGLLMKQDAEFGSKPEPDFILDMGLNLDGYIAGKTDRSRRGPFHSCGGITRSS